MRPPNPELLRLHERVHARVASELASLSQAMALDAERLRANQTDLLAGAPAVRDEQARLEAVRDVCRGVAARLEGVVGAAERNVAELRRKGDPEVDEMICSTTIVYNQSVFSPVCFSRVGLHTFRELFSSVLSFLSERALTTVFSRNYSVRLCPVPSIRSRLLPRSGPLVPTWNAQLAAPPIQQHIDTTVVERTAHKNASVVCDPRADGLDSSIWWRRTTRSRIPFTTSTAL